MGVLQFVKLVFALLGEFTNRLPYKMARGIWKNVFAIGDGFFGSTINSGLCHNLRFNGSEKPLLLSYNNEQIKSENRTTTLSLINIFGMLYVVLMGLVFGRIADYSIPIAFVSIGLLIGLFVVVLRTDKVAVQKVKSG